MEHFAADQAGPDGAGEAQPVARLVYASQASVQGSIYAEMERIRASAVRHNEPAGVATALLYQSGWFAQWKEGPRAAVQRIMDRVAGDPRHHSLHIVHSSEGPRLLDGPWSMAIVQCIDAPGDMALRVGSLRRDLEQGQQSSPPAVWRRISTPMRHPGAAAQSHPDAFQRVLVCAATGETSFGLVRWLAGRHREEVVHRRFAGAQHLDVGSDYVDFPMDGGVMRVVAMARNGLALPLTRAFLPDYSHVVALLTGERERDLALLNRIVQCCANLVAPPLLLGVSQHAAAHRELLALARRSGMQLMAVQSDIDDAGRCWDALEPLLASWRHSGASSGWPVAPFTFASAAAPESALSQRQ